MHRPVEVLAAVRRAVRRDGLVVVMDEAVADEFTAPGDVAALGLNRTTAGARQTMLTLPDLTRDRSAPGT
jgi:hypothetical protein